MGYNVRVAYNRRNGTVRSLNINWDERVYVKDTCDPGWRAYLEAKLASDVDELEKELIRSGFKEVKVEDVVLK